MLFNNSIILRIFKSIWMQPHPLIMPKTGCIASHHSCKLQLECNLSSYHNLAGWTDCYVIWLRFIKNLKTSWTVVDLAIAWRLCFEYYSIKWNKKCITSGFKIINAGNLIIVSGIYNPLVKQVLQVERSPTCHPIDDTFEYFWPFLHSTYPDWFKNSGQYRIPQLLSGLDFQNAVGYYYYSPEWIAISFFTADAEIVNLLHINLIIQCIPPEHYP